jgi:hypothetical protein
LHVREYKRTCFANSVSSVNLGRPLFGPFLVLPDDAGEALNVDPESLSISISLIAEILSNCINGVNCVCFMSDISHL